MTGRGRVRGEGRPVARPERADGTKPAHMSHAPAVTMIRSNGPYSLARPAVRRPFASQWSSPVAIAWRARISLAFPPSHPRHSGLFFSKAVAPRPVRSRLLRPWFADRSSLAAGPNPRLDRPGRFVRHPNRHADHDDRCGPVPSLS